MIRLTIFLALISGTLGARPKCDVDDSVDISQGTHLENGVIYFNGYQFKKNEYFLDENSNERGCICLKRTCMRKCCPLGFGYQYKKKTCIPLNEEFDPEVWDDYHVLENVKVKDVMQIITGKMECESTRIRISQLTKNFHIRLDGKMFVELEDSIPPYSIRSQDKYCMDTFATGNGTQLSTKLDALVCFDKDKEEHNYVLSFTCMLISCVFFLATVFVYSWLPELNNLHGRVLKAYLMCLFFGFLFLSTMQILLEVGNITREFCLGLTFVIYLSLLAAFFWLNVMCFDIWWTFSGKRGLSLEKLSNKGRFIAYSVYAFGIPIALTILLAALEFSNLPPGSLLPNLKQGGCFIHGRSKLLYFYGPIVVLCVANMLFFILTAVKIASIRRQTAMLKSKESSTHDPHRKDKQRLLLYVKLFIVMGVNWILEVISALYPEAISFFKYTDAYNVLIGLVIFIIFVCKKKILRLMKKRYRQIRGYPMSRNQTATSSRTSTTREEQSMTKMGSTKH